MTQFISKSTATNKRNEVQTALSQVRQQIQQIETQRIAHKKRTNQFAMAKNQLKRQLHSLKTQSDRYHKLLKNGKVTVDGVTTILTQ